MLNATDILLTTQMFFNELDSKCHTTVFRVPPHLAAYKNQPKTSLAKFQFYFFQHSRVSFLGEIPPSILSTFSSFVIHTVPPIAPIISHNKYRGYVLRSESQTLRQAVTIVAVILHYHSAI